MDHVSGSQARRRKDDRFPVTRLRPPGSVDAARFLELCDQCNQCLDICPSGLLTHDSNGYPVMQTLADICVGCGLCADVCTRGALVEFMSPVPGKVGEAPDRASILKLIEAAAPGVLRRVSGGD